MSQFDDFAPETLLDPGGIPSATAVLGGAGLVEDIRGLAGRVTRPVSSAVVIGLGGSGVQTVARIKAAVRSDRVDQQAEDKVAFLGIDAVGEDKLNPLLPDGVSLGSDLLNLTGFNAGTFLSGQLPTDTFLQGWWDHDYRVPSGELIDGLKRERMLGRLCFHQEVSRIRAALSGKFKEAMSLQSSTMAGGNVAAPGAEVAVYIVCSSTGGTGSSAFLEVLGAVHLVAQDLGVKAKVRAFVLLPNAFSTAIEGQNSSETIAMAQRANAYGFFKELDHFILNEDTFLETLGHTPRRRITNGDLIHSVYLFDANVGSSGMLNSIVDIYEIIAESIYQFLFSTVGRNILGSDGANIERILQETDTFGKPRRYCSLGLARILLPGDTYRFHLVMWWCDWLLRSGFLRELSAGAVIDLKESEEVANLLDTLDGFVRGSGEGQYDESVKGFLDVGREAPSALQVSPDVATAQETITTLEGQMPAVTLEVRRVLESARPRLVEQLSATVEKALFATTGSVPRAREVARVLVKRSSRQLADAESALTGRLTARTGATERVEAELEDLEVACGRNILEAAVANVVGLVKPDVQSAKDAAEALGSAIKDWTRAVIDAEVAQARRDYLELANKRLEVLLAELLKAERLLQQMADDARGYWERDEMIGKDTGPEATSVLLPEDVLPDIETSGLSRSIRQEIAEEHGAKLSDEALRELHQQVVKESLTRGFFDLGSRDPRRQKRAQDKFLHLLEDGAFQYALQVTDDEGNRRPRLPLDLLEAASVLGETARLGTAFQGLQRQSQEVCWSWDDGRLHLSGDDNRRKQDKPRVTTAVLAHRSVEALVMAEFNDPEVRGWSPDPERVIALSCEWAVPIHCLPAVDLWKEDYGQLQTKRERERQEKPKQGVEPPNHIDRRFEQFDDLLPEYVRLEAAAPVFAKGMLIAHALASQSTAEQVVALYERDATRPPLSPLRQERGVGFVTRRVSVVEGLLRPAPGGDTELGPDWFVAMKGVGVDIGVQTSINECWEVVVKAIDPELLTALIHELMTRIDRARKKRKITLRDRQALDHLENAFTDISDKLADYLL